VIRSVHRYNDRERHPHYEFESGYCRRLVANKSLAGAKLSSWRAGVSEVKELLENAIDAG